MSNNLGENHPKNQTLTAEEMNRISVSLPPYNREDPELWFAMAERAFDAMGITSEKAKYTYVSCALNSFWAQRVRDLIINPPQEYPYAKLKRKLVKAGIEVESSRKSLEKLEMGDRKPTELVEHLRKLNGEFHLPESVLGMVFLKALPNFLGRFLVAEMLESLDDEAAEIGDYILDKYYSRLVKRSTRKKKKVHKDKAVSLTPLPVRSADMMESLNKRISELTKNFQKELLEPANSTSQRKVQKSKSISRNSTTSDF